MYDAYEVRLFLLLVDLYKSMEELKFGKLPPYRFKVSCFPIKILKVSAAWVRPVAIIENQ